MKSLARLTTLAMLSFGLAAVTFAKNSNKNEGSFTLPDTVRVGTTDLRAGEYKAQWKEEGGGAVKIDILQHGKTVVTVEGKLKDLQQSAPYNAVIEKPLNGNGNENDNAKTIDEIDFSNRNLALVLGE
ncbi:MAG: hypothetical protein WBQ39_21375 [Terriglobales bacterium]